MIELLAVIILLAIIALIAYPTLNNVISNNKEKLYNKQIEELKRHANTWIMGNAETFDLEVGKNYILTFDEMYQFGLLQNKEIKDPRNSENLQGCMVLTRNGVNYDIRYNEKCPKIVNLSGNITYNKLSWDKSSELKVQLLKSEQVIYETTSDASGHYEFDGILSDSYLVLVSQPKKTKYGREVLVDEDKTYDMEAKMYSGDIDGDNVITKKDQDILKSCYNKSVADYPECTIANLIDDSFINGQDLTILNTNFDKRSDIIYNDTFKLTGTVTYQGTTKPTIKVGTHTTTVNDDGTFILENIPKGFYKLSIEKSGYLNYRETKMFLNDINDINVHLYAGDLTEDGVIDDDDVEIMQEALEEVSDPDMYEMYDFCDLNNDGVIDDNDLSMLQDNIGKTYNY